MQTKSRFDPPRNRTGYPIYSTNFWVGRKPEFDALNRAEYHIWSACKCRFDTSVPGRMECESHKAQARWCLEMARLLRETA